MHIKGTILSVTLAMPLIPPMMTSPVRTAIRVPNTHCLPAKTDASPPVMLISCAVAWLTWNILPPPNEANTHITAKKPASTIPTGFIPRSAKPSGGNTSRRRGPCPSASNSRYFTPSVHSANLVDMPRKPLRNSQNATPGPPLAMPMATPAMLPSPTVPETAALAPGNG